MYRKDFNIEVFVLLSCLIFTSYSLGQQKEEKPSGESTPGLTQSLSNFTLEDLAPPYIYDPTGRTDPFSVKEDAKDLSVESEPKDRLHPAENVSIDNLNIKAILWSNDENVTSKVLVQSREQRNTYTLTENDRIGKERAVIYRIDQDRVWTMRPYIDTNTGLEGYRPYVKRIISRGRPEQSGQFIFER